MWSRTLLTILACTQLSLVAIQGYQAPARAATAKPHPEGISSLVDRIADSQYGLLDPLPPDTPAAVPTTAPTPTLAVPLEELLDKQEQEQQLQHQPTPGGAPEWLWPILEQHAKQMGLDPYLIESMIAVESGFQPDAVSPVGAQGLMQLMPETAELVGVRDAFDPYQNVGGGTRYLSWQMQDFGGDLSLALAAYNAGPAAVRRWGGIPPYTETTNYVNSIMQDYRNKTEAQRLGNDAQLLRQDYSR
jgi:hypothetical protein